MPYHLFYWLRQLIPVQLNTYTLHVVRDDLNRHRADAHVNASLVEVLNKEKREFEKKPQGELHVGDIVKVNDGDIFPADLIFLRSGEEKAPKTCWINTKSLDGETDNKLRQAMKVSYYYYYCHFS